MSSVSWMSAALTYTDRCRWTSFPVRSLLSREWLWVDSNGKQGKGTFRRMANWSWVFVDISLGSYRPRGLKSQVVEDFRPKFAFLKKTPCGKIFKIMFRKDSSRHRSTSCVQISWNLAYGKVLRLSPSYVHIAIPVLWHCVKLWTIQRNKLQLTWHDFLTDSDSRAVPVRKLSLSFPKGEIPLRYPAH